MKLCYSETELLIVMTNLHDFVCIVIVDQGKGYWLEWIIPFVFA